MKFGKSWDSIVCKSDLLFKNELWMGSKFTWAKHWPLNEMEASWEESIILIWPKECMIWFAPMLRIRY